MVGQQGDGTISLEIHDKVAVISISNPLKRNAISGKMMVQFAMIVDTIVPSIASSNATSCNNLVGIVLLGQGNEAFCAGADFSLAKYIVNTSERGVLMAGFMTDALNRIRQSGLVSVCVVNGPALGGGAEITTACDFRLMNHRDNNFIQFVHAKIGASPGWGGARRLTQIVGRRAALRLCAASTPMKSADALQAGFVDDLIECDGVDDSDASHLAAGLAFLRPFTAQPYPGSVRAIKTAVASVEDCSVEESKRVEVDMFAQRWFGPDNQSALSKK